MGKGRGTCTERSELTLDPLSDQVSFIKRPQELDSPWARELFGWAKELGARIAIDPKQELGESRVRRGNFRLGWRQVVVVPSLKTEKEYFTFMHELVHVAHNDLKHFKRIDNVLPRLLDMETKAWRWALENASFNPSKEIQIFMQSMLSAYLHSIGYLAKSQGVDPVECIPVPEHDFWKLSGQSPDYLAEQERTSREVREKLDQVRSYLAARRQEREAAGLPSSGYEQLSGGSDRITQAS